MYQDKFIVIEDGSINVFKDENEYNEVVQSSVTINLLKAKEIKMDKESKTWYYISVPVDNNIYLIAFPNNHEECTKCYKGIMQHRHKQKSQKKPLREEEETKNNENNNIIQHTGRYRNRYIDKNNDDIKEEDMLTVAYGGSVTSKSPYNTMNTFLNKANSTDIDDEKKGLDIIPIQTTLPRQPSLGSNNSNDSSFDVEEEDKSDYEDIDDKGEKEKYNKHYKDKPKSYISASIKETHTGYYKFDDAIITVANIIQRNENKMTLKCVLIGEEGSNLRQSFEITRDDEKLCDLNKKEIEFSHRNVWKKWMITLNAKYRYKSEFDGEPFKNMISTIKRHPQLLFTIGYDNWKQKLQFKTYDDVIKSLFSFLLSIQCQNHDTDQGKIKMECNCSNATLFTKYSYHLIMAVIKDKHENYLHVKGVLNSLKYGTKDTAATIQRICSLLPMGLKQDTYFQEYRQYIQEWIDFDFYAFLCKACSCLNNSIMINRLFHYASKAESCRICGWETVSENNTKKKENFLSAPEETEGAHLTDTDEIDDEQYVSYETGNYIRYNVLQPRFQSLVRECTLNDVYIISRKHFNQYLKKAQNCHSEIAQLVVSTGNCKNYGIRKYAPIDVGHILTLIIYTEEVQYSRLFTKSYLSLNCTDPDIVIKNHCNNWYWFGRYIFESIEYFGKSFDACSEDKLYQGSMKLFKFDSFSFSINFPRSIFISQSTARHFATDKGIVLKLIPKYKSVLNNIKSLNQCLVSQKYDQEMRLLFGTNGAVQIQDIILGSNKKRSLRPYIASLSYLEKILSQTIFDTKFFNAEYLYDDLDEIQSILMKLIKICVDLQRINPNPSEIQESALKGVINKHMEFKQTDVGIMYIVNLMRYACNTMEFVTFEAFKSEIAYLSQDIINFFINKNAKSQKQINIYNLCLLLPNIKCFRNFSNKVQYISCIDYYDEKQDQDDDNDNDVKYNDDYETISEILPRSAIYEVPNHIISALDKISFQYDNKKTIKAMLRTKLMLVKDFEIKQEIPKILEEFHVEQEIINNFEKQLEEMDDKDIFIESILQSLEEHNSNIFISKDLKIQKKAFLSICKGLLMEYYQPISRLIDATLHDFVKVTKKIDLFDDKIGHKLNEYVFEKLLNDIERIKPWSCNQCWFRNRKMMIGGYFRFYNRLNSCGLCGNMRIGNSNIDRKSKSNILKMSNMDEDRDRANNNNKLSIPYIVNNWKKKKEEKENCQNLKNKYYLATFNVDQMTKLVILIIERIKSDTLNSHQNDIIKYFEKEELDGTAFIAMNKKDFAGRICKYVNNTKANSKLNKLYLEIKKLNINCNAMKRVALILENFGGLTKNMKKGDKYPYRWKQFLLSLDEQYGPTQFVDDIEHILEHNTIFPQFLAEQPHIIRCDAAENKICKHLKRTQFVENIYDSLRKKQKFYQCNDYKDFVYIKYLDAAHCAVLHKAINEEKEEVLYINNKLQDAADTIRKYGKYPIYQTGVLMQYDASLPLHANLKEEITNNSVYQIAEIEFDELLKQTKDKMVSIEWKKESKKWIANETNERYGIKIGDHLAIEHIICIAAYCSNSKLCTEFRKSYRSIDYDDNNTKIKIFHNSNFYWIGRFIYASITFFGKTPIKTQKDTHFYHGLSEQFLFSEFSAVFEIPTSTTTNVNVAKSSFSGGGAGIVLELAAKYNESNLSKCLDVSIVSGYGDHENERLFAGMTNILAIIDIQFGVGNKWYKSKEWCQMFLYFERITEQTIYQRDFYNFGITPKKDMKNWKKSQEKCLLPLINHQINRNINKVDDDGNNKDFKKIAPNLQYIYALFEHFCDSKTDYINLSCIQEERLFMHEKLVLILFKHSKQEQHDDSYKINQESLKLIFPNLKSYKNNMNEWRTLTRRNDEYSNMSSADIHGDSENKEEIAPIDITNISYPMKDIPLQPVLDENNSVITEGSPTSNNLAEKIDFNYVKNEGANLKHKTSTEHELISNFRSKKTRQDIEQIVVEYNQESKDDDGLKYWCIAQKIGEYVEKIFNDKNIVVIVSEKDLQPQISDLVSIIKLERTLENIEGIDIRIYRTVKHKNKYQQHTNSSFQQIVLNLSKLYNNANKIAHELESIYGTGCHVAMRVTDYSYEFNIYCHFSDGMIARATTNSSFVIAWRR